MSLARFRDLIRDESAATAVEYGLIAALMSMAGMAVFASMGDTLEEFFESVAVEVNNAVN